MIDFILHHLGLLIPLAGIGCVVVFQAAPNIKPFDSMRGDASSTSQGGDRRRTERK